MKHLLIGTIIAGILTYGGMRLPVDKNVTTGNVEARAVVPTLDQPTIDQLVDYSAKKYGKNKAQYLRIKAMIHPLLYKEALYGLNTNCGDSGKACGPLQFHAPTYTAYRKIMIKRGLVSEMGDRLNMVYAIDTAAWAISDGRENAWGPVLRGEIKL